MLYRLTKKVDFEYEGQYGANGFDCVDDNLQLVYDKLGKFEDILEEYNIDSLEKLNEILRIWFMRC